MTYDVEGEHISQNFAEDQKSLIKPTILLNNPCEIINIWSCYSTCPDLEFLGFSTDSNEQTGF